MSKFIPSTSFIIQVLIAMMLIFAVAALTGFGGLVTNPVGFIMGFFGKKSTPAA